jgi:4-hydroxybenzoate polyprenyltransferase
VFSEISTNASPERKVLLPRRTPRSIVWALLCLMRPANIVTAHSDILAGYAVAGAADSSRLLLLLLLATTGLYGGGVVLNDVFDAKLDAVERPERPIPSGAISVTAAGAFGGLLLICGVWAAWICSPLSGAVALAAAVSALLYDSWGKHHPVWGPFNMGLCRGLNLALGLTAASLTPFAHWPAALVTLGYIAGITSLSRGEVRGGTRIAAAISGVWLVISFAALVALVCFQGRSVVFAIPFFALLLYRIGKPFWRAFRTLSALEIRSAVKAGVLSLIVLNACIAAAFAGPWYGIAVLLLYVPAFLLAKLFAVT